MILYTIVKKKRDIFQLNEWTPDDINNSACCQVQSLSFPQNIHNFHHPGTKLLIRLLQVLLKQFMNFIHGIIPLIQFVVYRCGFRAYLLFVDIS